jgi:hypothetical protein
MKSLGTKLKRGRPLTRITPSKENLISLYTGEGKSIREAAKDFMQYEKNVIESGNRSSKRIG